MVRSVKLKARSLLLLLLAFGCSSLPDVDPHAAERACAASVGRLWCDGRCVTPATDVAHCGACGRACGDGMVCVEGRCDRRFSSLSASFQHTCGVEVGGAVWCWGANESAQVGDGDEAVAAPTPRRVAGVTATRVFAGYAHSCASAVDGSLVCWGANSHGELGGPGVSRLSLTPVTARGVMNTAVMAVGNGFSCAADAQGATLCWGSNEWGGLGDGRSGRRPPVAPAGVEGVTSMGAGWGHVCALAAKGEVWCWGSRGFAQVGDGVRSGITGVQPVPVRALSESSTALVVGNTNVCSLAGDGAVWCWGENVFALATPTEADHRWSPARVEGVEAVSLFGGFLTWYARRADGALVGWGLNDNGQLGVEGRPAGPVMALPTLASRVSTVVVGGGHACALLTDQTVRCWGNNNLGQLGNGSTGAVVRDPSPLQWAR